MTTLFTERLHALGFSTYPEYLRSPHWAAIGQTYRTHATLPQYCLGCQNPRFQLHHRTYARLGHEQVGDLIPLSHGCHTKVHAYLKEHGKPLEATHVALRKLFHRGKSVIRRQFRPFSKKRPRKRSTMAFNHVPLGPYIESAEGPKS